MPRRDSPHAQRNRVRIAQAAARLIAEHGLADWRAAKRKACRQLGLPEREGLPDNEEVEQALRDYNSLFQPAAQAASLRAQRMEALRWMEQLSSWYPVLVGAVAAGWATVHSEIRLELQAPDPKSVELALINAGIPYTAASPQGDGSGEAQLRVEHSGITVRLVVVSAEQRRNRSRRSDDERLALSGLRALLAGTES